MKKLYTKKYSASNTLLNYIDAYWIIQNQSDITIDIPIVPDGCMDIIYQNDELILVGAMDEGIVVSAKPNDYSFGIRFKPAVFAYLIDKKCSSFTNRILPLKDVSQELFDLLNFNEKDENTKVESLNRLFETLFKDIKLNENISHVISQIIKNKGDIQINDMLKSIKISQRQLERLFLNYVGYSPKKFSNIIRFFYTYKDLLKSGTDNLIEKAYDYGYCDQAHFNKEFKKFSNFSPTDEIMSIFYNTK